MDVTEKAKVLIENKDKAALLHDTLQKQRDQLSDILHSECGSGDELF